MLGLIRYDDWTKASAEGGATLTIEPAMRVTTGATAPVLYC
jgi:hypothetical protein